MALSPQQIASILKLRGIGWSQKEIADTIGASQQVGAYHLKKLREESKKKGADDVFSAALLGGLAMGAAAAGRASGVHSLIKGTHFLIYKLTAKNILFVQ